MKFWCVSLSRATTVHKAAGASLMLFASLSAIGVHAEEPAKPQAPAAPAAQPTTLAAAAQAAKPKAKPAAPAEPPECLRTGQRVIAALARDDSGAANQFHHFYEAFKCPPQHLAQSFGCLVNLQTANPSLNNPSPEQVSHCWNDPTILPKVEAPKPPETPAGN